MERLTTFSVSKFLVMNFNSIPAVYLTAQVAVGSIISLYLAVILCFPAYAYLDMKRQNAGRHDLFFWKKAENAAEPQPDKNHHLEYLLYDRFYKPMIFGKPSVRIITHSIIWAVASLLLALGLYGISQSTVGLGLEDFLPADHQGHIWASARSDILGSWVVTMNWPAINYTDSNVQMRMIQQFERVIDTPHIEEVDTRMLWIAGMFPSLLFVPIFILPHINCLPEFGLWTSRLCDYNLAPGDAKCGRDQVLETGSNCAGTWKANNLGLREKYSKESDDQCQPYDGGVCVPASKLHPTDILELNISMTDDSASWCPVFEGWSQAKTEFCLRTWHEIVGGDGSLVLDPELECDGEFCKDHMVKVPIPYSSGPPMTARDLLSHDLTLEMMHQTRAVCDQDPSLHCWMSGTRSGARYWLDSNVYIDFLHSFVCICKFRTSFRLLESVRGDPNESYGDCSCLYLYWLWNSIGIFCLEVFPRWASRKMEGTVGKSRRRNVDCEQLCVLPSFGDRTQRTRWGQPDRILDHELCLEFGFRCRILCPHHCKMA
jgi:hypothetical protein